MENKYFELFVHANISKSAIIRIMADIYDGNIFDDSLSSAYLNASVIDNSNYDLDKLTIFPDGFLHFNVLIEIDYNTNYEYLVIEKTNLFVTKLWNNNIPCVVSSDFENELVNNGGYNNASIPFPK